MNKRVLIMVLMPLLLSSCGVKEEHNHSFSNSWHSNSEGHYHKCSYAGCDEIKDFEVHDFNESGVCKVCFYSSNKEELNLSCEHDWSSWEITKEVSCEKAGEKQRKCNLCNVKICEEIPKLNHNFTNNNVISTDGSVSLIDSVCGNCNRHILMWHSNEVTDNCKNSKKLSQTVNDYGEYFYEPSYVENNDGSVAFYGRPIHNNMIGTFESNRTGWPDYVMAPVYDASVEGSFFEYKITLSEDISNIRLVAEIALHSASKGSKIFSADSSSWTPGLIDSVNNFYETRYVISLDGNYLDQDLTKDIIGETTERRFYTFPLSQNLSLSKGTHTLKINMGSGTISNFYNFGFEF